jgi:hypothetical protein
MSNQVENLASYQRCAQSIRANWPAFLEKREARLEQQQRHGVAAEKVAENIIEDLFTEVLDWTVADLNNQVEHADLLLSRLGIKYLAWNRRAVEAALDQALRYAGEQKVKCVAVSDGVMLYTADVEHGGLRDRAFVSLQSEEPQEKMLWRISLHGIYRPCESSEGAALDLIPEAKTEVDLAASPLEEQLLHPKYKVPARCFAYVGDPNKTATWKLPYRLADGSPDVKRLPKAIQAILSNYRGVKVSSVPEKDIPDVLVRLAHAAASQGRMPQQAADTAHVYVQLAEALAQLGRLEEVIDKGSWVRP